MSLARPTPKSQNKPIVFVGSYDGIVAFSQTELTEDLKKISVPTLVMHGDDDQIVPYADSAPLSAKLVKGAVLKTYNGFPHGMPTTNAAETMPTCSRSSRVRWPQQSERGFALKT
jgi:pimeloyl-ACP methyl ester carboxylesterase